MTRVVIAGGSGFIGRALAARLAAAGSDVVVLTRSARSAVSGATVAQWDGRTTGPWVSAIDDAAAVINLVGSPVARRHTGRTRREILSSRLDSVKAVAAAITGVARPPKVWIQASAVGYYGDTGDRIIDEDSPPGTGFLADVCRQWEGALAASATPGTRKVLLRFGVVLGRGGGALTPLARLARWGLGGAAGSGRQYVSWVHLEDVLRIIEWAILRPDASGAYNAVAPEPVTNAALMRGLRRTLGRPWSPPVPAWAVRTSTVITGIEASIALEGQRVIPKRLLDAGFGYRFPRLGDALADLLPSSPPR